MAERYAAWVIRWRSGVVSRLRREWDAALEIDLTVDGAPVRALAYPPLTPRPAPRTGGGPWCLRQGRRRRAARLVRPHDRRAARCGVDGRDGDRGPGVRW